MYSAWILLPFVVAGALMKEASQDETSEIFIGEWMEKRGIRDQMVVATKVSRHAL